MIRNKNIKLILNYVAGPLVFCILLYSIYAQVLRQSDWEGSLNRIGHAFNSRSLRLLTVVCLLMFVNWGIEARKWQLAISSIQRISFLTAFKAIFSGTTLAFFTPNRMGEYIGRMLHIDEENRMRSIAVTVFCGIAQLLITLITGIGGLIYISWFISNHQADHSSVIIWLNILCYVVFAGTIVLTIFYFRLSWLVRLIKRIPKIEKYITYIQALESFNATVLLRILSLSFGRYIVFIAQYYLLFQVFSVEISWWQSFWSVSAVFLVLAIIPGIAMITELGVRWKASIEVIQLFSANTAGILATSLAVWIINLVIPALIGSLLILGLKIFRIRNND